MSLSAVHRFIERLDRDASAVAAFRADAAQAMRQAGLSDDQVEALTVATLDSLAAIGVHPLLRIRYLRAHYPERGSFMSVRDWADRLPLEQSNG
jgi:hypothetical protein